MKPYSLQTECFEPLSRQQSTQKNNASGNFRNWDQFMTHDVTELSPELCMVLDTPVTGAH